jgi:hypothetical protein
VLALLNYFWDLCLLRAKPQDAPASYMLLLLALLANLLAGVLVLGDAFGGPVPAFLAALADDLLLMGFLWVLLTWRDRRSRFLQAMTALLGSGILLSLISFPLQLVAGTPSQPSAVAAWAGLSLLLLLVWIHLVMGHILRYTLEVVLAAGILLALVFNLISALLVQGLFSGH